MGAKIYTLLGRTPRGFIRPTGADILPMLSDVAHSRWWYDRLNGSALYQVGGCGREHLFTLVSRKFRISDDTAALLSVPWILTPLVARCACARGTAKP